MDHSMELTREQVLRREIPWETYVTAKLVTPTALQLIRRYDHKPENVQAAVLEENGPVYVGTFVALLHNIAKHETVEYILALIDEILSVNPRHARLFHDQSLAHEDIYGPFLRLLQKRNWFVQEKSCKILALIISSFPKNGESVDSPNGSIQSRANLPDNVLHALVNWLYGQLRRPSHPNRGIPTAISSLATLLRVPNVRSMFIHADGVKLIAPLLSPTTSQQHIQLLYETALCIWLLSFHDPATDQLAAAGVVPRLVEVAKTCTKEKVVRMAILALKNLLPKGTFASDMVEAGLSKTIKTLKLQNWSDEDLVEALDSLEASLDDNIRILSSFEKYKQEVISGVLDWTPMHKDPIFWMENVSKFEQNDFQVLRMLVTILDNSRDPKTKAIACHDLAHFIQSHPAGRGIVLDLRAKDRVMRLMDHENEEVRKEALLCVQKLLLSAKYAGCI